MNLIPSPATELLESLGIGTWAVDLGSGAVTWSALLQADLGPPPMLAPGGERRSLLDPVHPDDRELVEESLSRVGEVDAAAVVELRLRAGSGGWRWYVLRARAGCRDTAGRPTQLVGTMQLLENHEQAEKRSRTRRELMTFFAALEDEVYVFQPDGTLVHLNPRARARGSARVGGSILAAHPERVRDGARARLDAGSPTAWPYPLLAPDGREIPVETQLIPGEWDGRPTLVAITRDVGVRVAERRRIEESEALLRATLHSTTDGVLVVDERGRIATSNQRFQQMWSIPESLAASGDDSALLQFVVSQLAEPERFLAEVRRLYASDEVSFDTLNFRDGRVFERYSLPFSTAGTRARLWSFRDVTARARTDRALHATVAEFNSLVARIPVGVFKVRITADGSTRFEYVSPRWEALTGVSADEAYADPTTPFASVHPEDLPTFQAISAEARATPRIHQWKGRIIVRGEARWFELSSSPTLEPNGDVVWDSVLLDCTEREEADARVRLSEDRLRTTLESAPHVAVHWLDLDGRIVYWNQASTHLYGWTAEEVAGQPCEVIFGPQRSVAAARRAVEAIQHTGRHLGPTRFELRTKAGEPRVVEATLFLLPGEAGAPYLAAVEVDVTRLEQALRARERQRAFLAALFQTIPELVWLKDPDGVYLACNPRFEELYGASEAEILGKSDFDFVPAEMAQFFRDNDLLAINAGGPRRNEEWLRFARGGYEGLFETTKTPMYSEQGELVGVLGIAHDITDRKRAELELDGHRRHLEELVAARTAEALAARDAAQAANRTKSTFLANMSHEIRTPMNAILGLTHILRGSVADATQREQVEKVHKAAQHLLGLLNDILDLSKIEAGKLDLSEGSVDLEQLFADVLALVAERVAQKDVELVVELEPGLPAGLRGDAVKLRQVVLNYVNNAVKFTDRGTIILAAKAVAGSPGRIRIEVRDTGPGITPAELARLFQPFEQVDASTTRRHGGTGLGLAISRRLVERMSGEVGAESRVGVGSCFWFEVPLMVEDRLGPDRRVLLAGRDVVVVMPPGAAREALVVQLDARGARVQVAPDLPRGRDLLRHTTAGASPITFLDDRIAPLPPQAGLWVAVVGPCPPADGPGASTGIRLERPALPRTLDAALLQVLGAGEAGARQPSPKPSSGRPFRHARVLLAEDEPVNREVATTLLLSVGLEVETVANGAEAVERVRTRAYDLVLMDLQMPVLDGLEATRAIRALPGRETMAILAMTADAFEEDRQRCFDAGMDDHIAKPVEPVVLLRKVARWLPTTPTEEPPSVSAESFSWIPGLDLDTALSATVGRIDAFARLVRIFEQGHRDDMSRLGAALERADREQAERIAHSLKGVSATLGLGELARRAAAVERAIRTGAPTGTLLPPLQTELARILRALRVALPEVAEPTPQPIPPALARGWAERLLAAASADDVRAVALLRDGGAFVEVAVGSEAMQRIRRAVEACDFPTAARELQEALR